MKSCPWIDALWNNNDLTLPFTIDYDNEYRAKLENKYNVLIKEFENNNAPKYMVKIAKDYSEKILSAIDLYYRGDIVKSHTVIFKLIDNCCKNNEYAISNINDSIAFPQNANPAYSEVQFYRARLNDNVVDYPAEQMLHIPFKKRASVKSERFSIPGLPCLYLGNTSYVCWLEMGRPADFKFNVSPVVLDNTQKIFNLTVSYQDFYNIVDMEISEKERKDKLSSLLKIFLLNMATSFNVSEENRNFKSEYIISQIIMLACKNKQLNGITYHSKRVEHEIFAHILGVNLVLFADYDGEETNSKICDHIENGDSLNYSMFKQLMPSLYYKEYKLRIDMSPYAKTIGSFKRQFPYNETEFYYFDRYLFANWERTKIGMKEKVITK